MIDDFTKIAALVLRLGEVHRATRHADGITPESDTTHTVMLALCALRANDVLRLDPARLLTMALVHDLVEAYAGDTNTLTGLDSTAAHAKELRETAAADRIGQELPWLTPLIAEYEAQATAEARAIRYLDKIMPKLTHTLNGCSAIRAAGLRPLSLVLKHNVQGADLAIRYSDLPVIAAWFDMAAERAEDAWIDGPAAPVDHHTKP